MAGKVDTVLTALYFQLRVIYSTHMNDDSISPHELTKLYQSLCAMLLSVGWIDCVYVCDRFILPSYVSLRRFLYLRYFRDVLFV